MWKLKDSQQILQVFVMTLFRRIWPLIVFPLSLKVSHMISLGVIVFVFCGPIRPSETIWSFGVTQMVHSISTFCQYVVRW